ncbi:amidohydrolase family protein [Colwellia sp. 6_MG-2023]|uniref:amidohydrolase family protein n=1 Tax=Colwellia sp. 6_MG-2023 TaxID=3062676 RepID=UPI0026E2FDE0|nr:amidohydrolase family protein [Colwellia sp. 6_MG-2023]MDO6486220.1 amidohydrolase family protein [Colwellia sp. 6_MG-2023]
MKKYLVAISVITQALAACSTPNSNLNNQYYTMVDYYAVKKIDAHVHANNSSTAFIMQAKNDNMKLLSINVDYQDFPNIDKQAEIAHQFAKEHPNKFYFATTFSMEGSNNGQWKNNVIKRIDAEIGEGAVAVKVWKNIGMAEKDNKQNLIMIDDPLFTPIFKHLTDIHIPLIGHQGEPKNCWLPVSQMTVNNDKQYFTAHPQYHMYLHPEMPSYEDQMQARNNMLNNHPTLQFMGAHLASLEWSVDQISIFLDTYPDAVVDLAARMGQIQYQSTLDRSKVRNFFIKYQNRILYATDLTHSPTVSDAQFKSQAHKKWLEDWQYLTSNQTISVPEVDGEIISLALPKNVIDNLYAKNAIRFFNLAPKT